MMDGIRCAVWLDDDDEIEFSVFLFILSNSKANAIARISD